ncbi:MAG: cation transporter [Marinilabiliales bacterium]|nr:MAG: cation transporter [Marinilabiliales bacterium]
MATEQQRTQIIIKASWVAIIGNAVLSVLKIVVGLISGSISVVADGVDSASDIITSLVTLLTARIISKPPNPNFAYGYGKADTVAAKALSFIIFFAGAQLALSTIDNILNPAERDLPGIISVYIIIISIVGKFALAWYLNKTGKKIDSQMLIVNGRNMQNDVVISVSVLIGLGFTFWFELPILDTITALLVSFHIMFIAFRIFMQTNRDLMDGISDTEIYKNIIEIVNSVDGAHNPHRIRVRKLANLYLVALDLEIDGNLSLNQAHEISNQVDALIKEKIDNIYDVLIHVDPKGIEEDEAYGVSESDLK